MRLVLGGQIVQLAGDLAACWDSAKWVATSSEPGGTMVAIAAWMPTLNAAASKGGGSCRLISSSWICPAWLRTSRS